MYMCNPFRIPVIRFVSFMFYCYLVAVQLLRPIPSRIVTVRYNLSVCEPENLIKGRNEEGNDEGLVVFDRHVDNPRRQNMQTGHHRFLPDVLLSTVFRFIEYWMSWHRIHHFIFNLGQKQPVLIPRLAGLSVLGGLLEMSLWARHKIAKNIRRK